MAYDVADREEDPAVGEDERVVPVAADRQARGTGQVATGDRDPRNVGEHGRQEAALQHFDHFTVVLVSLRVLERRRDPASDLEGDRDVVGFVTTPRRPVAETERTEGAVAPDERHREVGVQRAQFGADRRDLAYVHTFDELACRAGRKVLDEHRAPGAHRFTRRDVCTEVVRRQRRPVDRLLDARVLVSGSDEIEAAALDEVDAGAVGEVGEQQARDAPQPLVGVEFHGEQLADACEQLEAARRPRGFLRQPHAFEHLRDAPPEFARATLMSASR